MKSLPGIVEYEFGLGWCALDLCLYLSWLRFVPRFACERGIFRYHLVSATAYSLLALGGFAWAPSWNAFAIAAGLIAARGIYSISFLELWSLAEGSYSLSILRGIDEKHGSTSSDLIERFGKLGEAKKTSRVDALRKMHLILKKGGRIELTLAGRIVATGCAVLRFLPNLKETG